jgi:hypothetical protein
VGKELAELEGDRDAGKPGAQQRLKSFKAERVIEADSIVEVGFRSIVCIPFHNSSNRVASNLRNGLRRKHVPRLKQLLKGEPKGATREY